MQKGLDGTPEVLLDPNTFSKDGTIALHGFELSKDGRYAAYSVSAIPGSDWEETRVMDIAARKTLPDTLKWIKFSTPAWRGNGFYYSRYPQPAKGAELTTGAANQAVYYHKLGDTQEQDVKIYDDPGPSASQCRDRHDRRRALRATLTSVTTRKKATRSCSATKPKLKANPRLIQARTAAARRLRRSFST